MASRFCVGVDDIPYSFGVKGLRVEDPLGRSKGSRRNILRLLTTQWVEKFVQIKDGDTGLVKSMDFGERRYLKRIYDTANNNILLMTSRQTEKSTSLCNRLLALSGMRPMYTSLFVTPSAMQTTVFSRARIDETISVSPLIRALTSQELIMNILEKEFANRSKIYLRYAFLSADRIRGLSVNAVFADEIQDLLQDVMPIIEETASHHKSPLFVYSGTPKTFDNTMESYWAKQSTQNEWAIPCEHHGTPNNPGSWHWNVLGPKSLGKTGPICDVKSCSKPINPEHPMAQWVSMNPGAEWEGFRICRLMVPWFFKNPEKWAKILACRERYPTAQFMNEIMALSYDSGIKPVTRSEVIRACDPAFPMTEEHVCSLRGNADLYAGIDWGCHDDQTRILTPRGFVHFKDLGDNDLVAQWDPDTRVMSFVEPKIRTVRDWSQPILRFKNRGGVDLAVTHTHRMRVGSQCSETWKTESAGETAERKYHVKFVGYVSWEGRERAHFVLPGVEKSSGYPGSKERKFPMDTWLEFVGYLVTEGGICKSNSHGKRRLSCLKMSQRETVNYETAQRIQDVLDRLGIPYQKYPNPKTGDINWTICGKQYWLWYAQNIGTSCATTRLPREFLDLSRRQLRILFDAMVDGDGSVDPREGCTGGAYYSTSKGLCEDFQEICIRLGLRCVVRLHKPASGKRKTRWRALWSEGRDHYFNFPAERVERVPYTGKVYCCAVPSGYIVTERNGTISYQGNTGEHSYTLMTVGGYVRGDAGFQIVFAKRFDGPLTDPEPQMEEIIRLLRLFRIKYSGTDYGMGFHPNKKLLSIFGPKRIHQFQYAVRSPAKIIYKPRFHRYMVYRTPVMADLFNAIKAGKVRFPSWDVFRTPYAEDILGIRAEYSETLKMIKYDHPRSCPDDTFHATLYALMASMFDHRRPDILAPIRETQDEAQRSISEDYAIEEIESWAAMDYGISSK